MPTEDLQRPRPFFFFGPVNAKLVPEHFKFCPSCGSGKVVLSEQKCLCCPDCAFTLYFNPSASAGALIFDRQGRLLVVERARDPSKGKYGIPGGFVDAGERLEEVVVRETKEETNLDIKDLQFFASFPNAYVYRDVNYAVTDTYFLAKVDSFDGQLAQEGEVSGIHLVDPRTVPSSQWAFSSLREAMAKHLEELKD